MVNFNGDVVTEANKIRQIKNENRSHSVISIALAEFVAENECDPPRVSTAAARILKKGC